MKENYEGAVKDLSKYISQYPSDGDGWTARGRAKTWLDDWDGACYDWKRGAVPKSFEIASAPSTTVSIKSKSLGTPKLLRGCLFSFV